MNIKNLKKLRDTIACFRAQITQSLEAGNIPADYSLGFANGLIFAEHKLAGALGNVKYFDRTGSIGKLPKPVALTPNPSVTDVGIFYSLQSNIVLAAKNVVDNIDYDEKRNTINITAKAVEQLVKLQKAVDTLTNFVIDQEEMKDGVLEEAKTGKPNDDEDAGKALAGSEQRKSDETSGEAGRVTQLFGKKSAAEVRGEG